MGYVQTRLLMGGMAGLHDAPRSLPLVGAAAVVGLVLWGALIDGESHWMWVLPFSGVVCGAAFGAGRVGRWLVVGGGCLAAFAVGALAASVEAGTAGAFVLASFALAGLLQVWIWDVTLRLDGARAQAGEVAVLRERLRFAGDLHDIQGHQLQAIALKAQLAARLIGVDDEAARGHAEDAHRLALQALSETRELVQGYRRVGLATELANAVGILQAAGVDAEVEGTPESVPVALQPLFGSLVREGATNLLRHTRAARCEIAVERDGDDVVVRVIDDGVARVVVPNGDGTGVAGLRERFAAVGGQVEATPLAPRGFELCGRAPHKADRMIRLLLADDEDLIREALATLLELEPDFKVVAQAGNGRAAVELAAEHQPDLVVLDLEMPELDGVSATEAILAARQVPVVLLTRHARPGVLRRALAAGARAFVPKTTPADRLARILRDVHAGGRYVDSEIAATALTEGTCPLSPRELDLLRHVHARPQRERDRRGRAPRARHRPQLPLLRDGQAQRADPRRGGADRLRGRLDLGPRLRETTDPLDGNARTRPEAYGPSFEP